MRLPRIYPILDTAMLARRDCPVARAAEAFVEAGAGILQFRHKEYWSRSVFEQAQSVARLCREEGCGFIVNDRADYAMLLGAGLHLGQDDLAPRDARTLLGTEAVIGFSTHNQLQLAASGAEPVTYVALGPVFGTVSKRNPDPVIGLEQFARWAALTDRPLVAIGGITRENAAAVLRAGAASVAVISDLLPDVCSSANLRNRMEQWQQLAKS